MPTAPSNVGFSNRPFRVKRFQTIHHYSVDAAHGLVLLFGVGAKQAGRAMLPPSGQQGLAFMAGPGSPWLIYTGWGLAYWVEPQQNRRCYKLGFSVQARRL